MVATDVASRGIGMIQNSPRAALHCPPLPSLILFPMSTIISYCVIRFVLCSFLLVRATCRCYYNLVPGLAPLGRFSNEPRNTCSQHFVGMLAYFFLFLLLRPPCTIKARCQPCVVRSAFAKCVWWDSEVAEYAKVAMPIPSCRMTRLQIMTVERCNTTSSLFLFFPLLAAKRSFVLLR
jgi:hypothetical protein